MKVARSIAHVTFLIFMGGVAMSSSGCWWMAEMQQRQQAEHRAAMDGEVGVWVGKTSGELLAKEGPPDVVLDDPSGAKIWVYTTEKSTLNPGQITINKSGDYLSATQSQGTIDTTRTSAMFWIDKAGRITKADWHEK